jgi:N-acetylglucosaminyl-diphospho-decaprenol L-rhamnosyltransferase
VYLSIILVNYNGGDLVLRCIESIYQNPPNADFEIIFIDNASTDGSFAKVVAQFPGLHFIENKTNNGLAKSFNQGLSIAKGRYLLSLDNDTRVLPGALHALLEFLDRIPDAGAVGSKLLNTDLSPQKTARVRPSAINAIFGRRSWITKIWPSNPISSRYLMEEHLDSDRPYEVDWVSTAALLIRKEVYQQVGGLDEDFFVYWVDADWCERIKAHEWKIYSVPESLIIHDENLKAKRRSRKNLKMVIDFHKGAYRYYRKHHAPSPFNPMAIIALVGLTLRIVLIVGEDYLKYQLSSLFTSTK